MITDRNGLSADVEYVIDANGTRAAHPSIDNPVEMRQPSGQT
jgi:hypothetical protein